MRDDRFRKDRFLVSILSDDIVPYSGGLVIPTNRNKRCVSYFYIVNFYITLGDVDRIANKVTLLEMNLKESHLPNTVKDDEVLGVHLLEFVYLYDDTIGDQDYIERFIRDVIYPYTYEGYTG